MALVQKAFSDIITFSRSSNATRIGPTGLVEYAPHNLQVRSQEFENAIWTKAGATITANATAAPDGTVTAEKLVEDSSNGDHQTYQIGLTVVAQSYTASVYAKAAERTNIWLALFNGTNNGGVYFNLANGTAGGLGTDITAASITPAGNGWYRCSITRTMVASANAGINIQLADAIPFISYVGNGSSGVYIWGAQLAVGPYALDYTPTTSAAVYGPRFDFDPVTLAARGLLVEESRTNLATYSEQFDNAAWTKLEASVIVNAAASPTGTIAADKLAETANTDEHAAYRAYTSLASTPYTLSVYAKASERTFVAVSLGFSNSIAWFDLSTGVIGTVQSAVTAAIQSVGNGWYRCSVTGTPGSATQNAVIETASSNGVNVFAGTAGSGIFIWGAQLEANASFASSYIPTLASTVTRSADVASVNTLSPWFNATEGTFLSNVSPLAIDNDISLSASDSGGYANSMYLPADSGAQFIVVNSSVVEAQIDAGTILANTPNKIAAAYAANNFALSVNGGAVVTDTSGAIPTVDRLVLGGLEGNTANRLNGHLRQVAYYPRRLTNAELQALSA